MNIIRQETDYALRLIAQLGAVEPNARSTRTLAQTAGVPYEFACKIMQKLHEAGIIISIMGPRGGFKLSENAQSMTVLHVIRAMQGNLTVNNCFSQDPCCRKEGCPLSSRMGQLQGYMEGFFSAIALAEVIANAKSNAGQLAAGTQSQPGGL